MVAPLKSAFVRLASMNFTSVRSAFLKFAFLRFDLVKSALSRIAFLKVLKNLKLQLIFAFAT